MSIHRVQSLSNCLSFSLSSQVCVTKPVDQLSNLPNPPLKTKSFSKERIPRLAITTTPQNQTQGALVCPRIVISFVLQDFRTAQDHSKCCIQTKRTASAERKTRSRLVLEGNGLVE